MPLAVDEITFTQMIPPNPIRNIIYTQLVVHKNTFYQQRIQSKSEKNNVNHIFLELYCRKKNMFQYFYSSCLITPMTQINDMLKLILKKDKYTLILYIVIVTWLRMTLQWRNYGHDGVSNHQPQQCLLNRSFGRRSKKTSKLRVTGLCVGKSLGPVNSPHK